MAPNLTGSVCLVTGASKGIGRGVALQLGQAGAKVYITGRTKSDLDSCAVEIENRGGKAVTVVVDHNDDAAVEALFKKISDENNGRLDVCVNNAYAGVGLTRKQAGKEFWHHDPVETWDTVCGVGLRNHYICTNYASRLMVERKDGLIVNISSAGGLWYLFNTAYGTGKAALDKMAHDCGTELKKTNVTMLSLWPGPVNTENVQKAKAEGRSSALFADAESQEFAGMAVVHLAADKNRISKACKIILTADCAHEYGFTDSNGKINGDIKALSMQLTRAGWVKTAAWTPSWIRIPASLLWLSGSKFG